MRFCGCVLLLSLLVCSFSSVAAKCSDLKIADFGNDEITAGCRLWMHVVPQDYAKTGSYAHAATADGGVLSVLWSGQHCINVVNLDDSFRVWSGASGEVGDRSDTTLANARYTRVVFIVTYDRKVFYILDDGKLKFADTVADRVTHVAGNGATAGDRSALLKSLGPPKNAQLGAAFQGMVSASGIVYIGVLVANSGGAILRYDGEIVSLAVPYPEDPKTFPDADVYGYVKSIFSPPPGSDSDLMILSECDASACYRLSEYTRATNTRKVSHDPFAPGYPDWFGRGGNVAQPTQDKSVVLYIMNTLVSPKSTHFKLLKLDTSEVAAGLSTGIGTSSDAAQGISQSTWADQVHVGIIYGMTFTPDDRQLWMAYRGAKRSFLIRVMWTDGSAAPVPPELPPSTTIPSPEQPPSLPPATPSPAQSVSPASGARSEHQESPDEGNDAVWKPVAIAFGVLLGVVFVSIGGIVFYKMRSSASTPQFTSVKLDPPVVDSSSITEQPP